MITENVLKLFLTSGVTLTVKETDQNSIGTLTELLAHVTYCMANQIMIMFHVELTFEFEDEKKQEVHHEYVIPHDRISWVMIEKVGKA